MQSILWQRGKQIGVVNKVEHPANQAVLVGNATPPEARSLLEAAEEHRDLVDALPLVIEVGVLSCGFKGSKTTRLEGLTQPLSQIY